LLFPLRLLPLFAVDFFFPLRPIVNNYHNNIIRHRILLSLRKSPIEQQLPSYNIKQRDQDDPHKDLFYYSTLPVKIKHKNWKWERKKRNQLQMTAAVSGPVAVPSKN
jgi:hypothetical protein